MGQAGRGKSNMSESMSSNTAWGWGCGEEPRLSSHINILTDFVVVVTSGP